MSGLSDLELERVDSVKRFYHKWGKWILLALLIVFSFFGIKNWHETKQNNHLERASQVYFQMLSSEQGELSAELLKNNYADTVYGAVAALWLARKAVDESDYDKAILELEWVQANSADLVWKNIAAMRQARILNSLSRYDEALVVLNEQNFMGLFDDAAKAISGTSYVGLGDLSSAEADYEQALSLYMQLDAPQEVWLLEILNNIGVSRSDALEVNQSLEAQL